jgi:exopolyphosphatase/guanosine-5'-triphosphate,3'-diphosphate pyrophosphatase
LPPAGRAPADSGFTVVDAFPAWCGSGEGLGTSGKIHPEAMDRAVAALSVCAEKLRRRRVSLARPSRPRHAAAPSTAATSWSGCAARPASCWRSSRPEEEARLAMLGCHRLLEPGDGPALIFDIGGGSTELVLIDTDGAIPRASVLVERALGGRVADRERGTAPTTDEERLAGYGRMRDRVRHAFRRFQRCCRQQARQSA